MIFLLTAQDGKDEGALGRRLAAREAHLASIRRLKAEGRLVFAGAILDEAGRMVGSSVVLEAPDRAAAEALIRDDPYAVAGVWVTWTLVPFRVAPV